MAAQQEASTGDGFIRLLLPRGVLLKLTMEEYRRAVKRGKAEKRMTQHTARETQQHAQQEADILGWIEER
jgi:hypothetical protein